MLKYGTRYQFGVRAVDSARNYGGATLTSASGSAWATFGFAGSAVALIAPRRWGGGTASVRVDGVTVADARFYASRLMPRQVVFGRRWSSSGSHSSRCARRPGRRRSTHSSS